MLVTIFVESQVTPGIEQQAVSFVCACVCDTAVVLPIRSQFLTTQQQSAEAAVQVTGTVGAHGDEQPQVVTAEGTYKVVIPQLTGKAPETPVSEIRLGINTSLITSR